MAATGYTPILIYASGTATNVPLAANLTSGASGAELALNYADGKLYYKDNSGVVQLLASKAGASGSVTSVNVSGGTTGLTTSGGPVTTSGTITLAGTLATTNGGTGLTSFTANGLMYASSTSALTTGSVLTFDGSSMVLNTSTSSNALRITQTGTGNALVVEDSANPDSSPFVIDAGGNVIIGDTASKSFYLPGYLTNYGAGIQGTGTAYNVGGAWMALSQWSTSTTASGGAFVSLNKSNGSPGTHTIVTSGQRVGGIGFAGSDGTKFLGVADIYGEVDGTPGTDDMPGRLVFSTTADGANTPTERLRIDSTGAIGLGSTGAPSICVTMGRGITGATTAYGVRQNFQVQSDVTSIAHINQTNITTQATAFTLGTLNHYFANQSTVGAGSTINNQFGFVASSTLTGATNNYGFYSNIAASSVTAGSFVVGTSYKITFIGTTDFTLIGASSNTVGTVFTATGAGTGTGTAYVNGRWNFFSNGTAENVFNGNTIISVSSGLDALRITQTGAGNALVVEDQSNPDSTPFVVDTIGRLITGYTSALTTYSAGGANRTPQFQIQGSSTSFASQSITNWASGTTPTGASYLILSKSKSDSVGVQDTLLRLDAANQYIGVLQFNGDDGTNFIPSAWIRSATDGTPGANIMPGRLEFATTADNNSSPTERMRLDKIGQQTQFGPLVVSNTLRNDVIPDSKSFDVSTQEAGATGIAFRPDGKMMYILGTSGDDITYYSLSTAWDISTATFVSQSNSTTAQNGTPQGLYFKPDGTKVFIVGSAAPAGVWSYSCTSPWDVSTITYDSKTVDLSAFTTSPTGIWFKPDGTKMYITSNTGATSTYTDTVLEYTLTTAWDLNTAAFSTSYLSVAAQDTAPAGVQFTNDGMRMFVAGQAGDTVVVYDLSTAWDLSTASFAVETSNLQTISGATLTITDLYVEPNGQKLYILSDTGSGAGTNMVYQFTALEPATVNLTGDTAISGNTTVTQDLTVYGSAVFSNGSSGNVGIGTSSPGAKLNVVDSSSNDALRITQTGTGNALVVEDSANPDSTPFVINAGGAVIAGNASAITIAGGSPQIQNHSTGASGSLVSTTRWATGTGAGGFSMAHSRGATIGAYDSLVSGDVFGSLSFQGADGTGFIEGANITAYVDGTPGTNDMPGRLVFSTTADGASSPTERMRIDSSGNVGIGTSSPVAALSVSKQTTALSGTSQPYGVHIYPTGSGLCYIDALTSSSSNTSLGFRTYNNGTYNEVRIDSSGNLLVGTTTAVGAITVRGANSSSAGNSFQANNSSAVEIFRLRNDGAVYTGTSTSGLGGCPYNNTTANAANMVVGTGGDLQRSTSSLRYKTEIQDATHGLADVMQLRSVTYKGKSDGEKVFGGLIAEEVDAVGLTEFVTYDDQNRPDALAYGNMVSLCIKAIQELKAELDATKAEIAALKG